MFFGKNPPQGVADALPGFVDTLKAQHPEIKSWAIVGVSNSNTFTDTLSIYPSWSELMLKNYT